MIWSLLFSSQILQISILYINPPKYLLWARMILERNKMRFHDFLHPLHSWIHMFPERVPLLEWPLHPRPLVLWWRGWLQWRLWWTPLLQWVLQKDSLTTKMGLLALCVCPLPRHQLLCYCVFMPLRQSASVCCVRELCEWCSGDCKSVVYFFVDDVVSQASYCVLHSCVVTPLNVLWQTAPPPPFVHQGLQSLTLAFV